MRVLINPNLYLKGVKLISEETSVRLFTINRSDKLALAITGTLLR